MGLLQGNEGTGTSLGSIDRGPVTSDGLGATAVGSLVIEETGALAVAIVTRQGLLEMTGRGRERDMLQSLGLPAACRASS